MSQGELQLECEHEPQAILIALGIVEHYVLEPPPQRSKKAETGPFITPEPYAGLSLDWSRSMEAPSSRTNSKHTVFISQGHQAEAREVSEPRLAGCAECRLGRLFHPS